MKHAHPVKQGNVGNPWQEHNHSTSEFLLLDQMFNTFFWIFLFFIYLIISLRVTREFISANYCHPKKRYLFYLLNYHAPPSSSY
ncbi:MAG: hypothetical protein JXR66_10260 [Bacteroidales bacterium]|nr:hypothetical protein [Bacteroidales bacterium]